MKKITLLLSAIFIFVVAFNPSISQGDTGILLQLREQKDCTIYNPDISFTKPSGVSNGLKVSSTTPSLGNGYVFAVFDKSFLSGKKVSINWSAYSNWAQFSFQVIIYDGAYDRASDSDFSPTAYSNCGYPLLKGNGHLQTIETLWGSSSVHTTVGTVNVGGASLDKVTLFIVLNDAWIQQIGNMDIYELKILNSDNSVAGIFDLSGSPNMERIGTYGDYGTLGSFINQPTQNLSVSCSANPSSINTNQSTTFISSVSGGTGSYIYSWSGACTGSSSSCSNSFPNAGTYTATVNVTSGTQTGNANCLVNINSQNINHSYKQCYNSDVYWYDSQGARQEMYEDCGDDSWTSNYQCSGSTWLQRQKTIRWCSGETCQQSLRFDNYQDCSALGQTCHNNQCSGQSQNRYLNCYDNDVYWYDYLGGRQEKYQDCGNSYCDATGSNYCVGNSVYRQRTCYNRGCASNACYSSTSYSDNQLVQTCSYGQTCQNGSCTSACECTSGVCCDGCHYKNTYSICNTETQNEYGCPWGSACGSDVGQRTKTRNQYCSGYSASCTGIWSNWTGLSNWTLVDSCSIDETCIYGSSVCQPKSGCTGPIYILHYTKKCYDSDLYWYDSLNVRQDKYRDCQDANECTVDSCSNNQCRNELQCDGTTCVKGSTDYCSVCDYCGDGACNCGENISSCQEDCSVIGLALTLFGKKESEAVQWLKTFSAGSIEKIDFLAVISNGENRTMDNVVVKVEFPQEVLYKGELMLEGVPYAGDIRTGVTLGSLAPKVTKTITFKGEIASEHSLFRSVADVIGTITTASGSASDNVQINFLKEGQQIVSKSEGWLAGLLGINLNKPIYILLIIIIVILVLVGLSRIIRGFKK